MGEIPKEAQEVLQGHLLGIAKLFKASKITLIVRAPEDGNSKGDMHFGNDNPTIALETFRRLLVEEAQRRNVAPAPPTTQEKDQASG